MTSMQAISLTDRSDGVGESDNAILERDNHNDFTTKNKDPGRDIRRLYHQTLYGCCVSQA